MHGGDDMGYTCISQVCSCSLILNPFKESPNLEDQLSSETSILVINNIKLRYLCRNKLPRIIFVLMHGNDYVINTSSIRLRVWR